MWILSAIYKSSDWDSSWSWLFWSALFWAVLSLSGMLFSIDWASEFILNLLSLLSFYLKSLAKLSGDLKLPRLLAILSASRSSRISIFYLSISSSSKEWLLIFSLFSIVFMRGLFKFFAWSSLSYALWICFKPRSFPLLRLLYIVKWPSATFEGRFFSPPTPPPAL